MNQNQEQPPGVTQSLKRAQVKREGPEGGAGGKLVAALKSRGFILWES